MTEYTQIPTDLDALIINMINRTMKKSKKGGDLAYIDLYYWVRNAIAVFVKKDGNDDISWVSIVTKDGLELVIDTTGVYVSHVAKVIA